MKLRLKGRDLSLEESLLLSQFCPKRVDDDERILEEGGSGTHQEKLIRKGDVKPKTGRGLAWGHDAIP